MESGAASDVQIWVQKTFCDAKHLPPWLTLQRLCDQWFIAGTSHPNEPWHWLQAFLQTDNTGPSNSISTLRLSSRDYKAGCGSCPTGTRLIFHAARYLLQTIGPFRLFLLMWKKRGCFVYEKEREGAIRQVAQAAIKDIWKLWWRFESCMEELGDPEKQSDCALGNIRLLFLCACADSIDFNSVELDKGWQEGFCHYFFTLWCQETKKAPNKKRSHENSWRHKNTYFLCNVILYFFICPYMCVCVRSRMHVSVVPLHLTWLGLYSAWVSFPHFKVLIFLNLVNFN